MKKIYISPIVLFLTFFSLITNRFSEYFLIFIIALIHELSHLVSSKFFGYKIASFKIMPYGACLEIYGPFSNSSEELAVSVCGPLANLVMLIICMIIKYKYSIDTEFYACINIYMMLLNMIPALPLDGGRIFKCLLNDCFYEEYKSIYNILNIISSLFVLFLGVFLLFKTKENFSLMIAGVFMISNTRNNTAKCENVFNLINDKRKYYRPKIIVLNENLIISESLKYVKMDKFFIIYLIDDNKNIVATITNVELFNFALNNKTYFKLKEVIKKDGKSDEQKHLG